MTMKHIHTPEEKLGALERVKERMARGHSQNMACMFEEVSVTSFISWRDRVEARAEGQTPLQALANRPPGRRPARHS